MRTAISPALLTVFFANLPLLAADPQFVGESRLVLQQVAAEPDIVTPTGVAVDAKGRIWVIENHTHQRPSNYKGPPSDRIRVLDDFDPKTGKARRIRTATEGFQNSMGLAFNDEGKLFLATRAALYELLLAADGETVTGKKEIVKLETNGNYPHNGLSGFAFDGVGHLLFGLGENFGENYTLKGTDGKTLKGGGEGGSIYRCNADGSGLQRVATGFWNPFAMCYDPLGNLFAVDNDPDARGPCRLLHVIDGGDYGYRFRYGRKGLHPFVCWNGELPGTLPMVAGTLEAPSGILSYEGNYLPKDYLGKLFVTSWGDHVIEVFETQPKMSSFSATSKILLNGDDQFRPVGIVQAPDGSVVISDWVDKSYPVHGKGRIWRITGANRTSSAPVIDSSTKIEDLKRGLEDEDKFVRLQSGREIAKRKDGLLSLQQILTRSAKPTARLTAMHAIYRKFPDNRSDIYSVLLSNSEVQPEAIRLIRIDRKLRNGIEPRILSELIPKLSPLAERELTATLDETSSSRLVLESKLTGEDPFFKAMAIDRLAREHSVSSLQIMFEVSDHLQIEIPWDMMLVVLQRRMILEPDEKRDIKLYGALKHRDPTVRQTAVRIIAEEKLTEYYPKLADALTVQPVTRELVETFVAAENWIAFKEPVMKKEFDASEGVIRYLDDEKYPKAIRSQFLKLVDPASKALKTETLLKWYTEGEPADKVQALKLLSMRGDNASRDFFAERLEPKIDQQLWRAATARLAKDPTPKATATIVAEVARPERLHDALLYLESAPLTAEQKQAIHGDCEKQVESAKSPAEAADIAESAMRFSLKQGFAETLNTPIGKHLPHRPAQVTDSAAWEKILAGPADAEAGERIFFHPNGAKCFACHRVQGKGAMVGPELSRIGSALKREKLIESILQPSREIAPLFTAWQISTSDGKTRLGLIVSENFDSTVSVAGIDGKVERIKKLDIEDKKASAKSLMPDGLENLLTLQEFRDLLAYLESLK